MKTVYIYRVTNTVNGKVYIGQTSQIPKRRWTTHIYDAINGSDLYFHRAIRKYGEDAFQFEVLLAGLTREEANLKECELIAEYGALDRDKGYNATFGGIGANHTEEAKAKISAASTEYWADPVNRAAASKARRGLLAGEKNPMFGVRGEDHPFFGRTHTAETRAKQSAIKKEMFQDPEFKAAHVAANLGKHHTEEGCANISKALEGNQYRTGIPHSDEAKARISASLKKTLAAKRAKQVCAGAEIPAFDAPSVGQ